MQNSEGPTDPAPAPEKRNGKRIRILIADDSVAFRNALEQFLERLPEVEVVGAAEDGEHALALVAGTRPDLVLMDLQMPRLNGLQATRRIRNEFPGVRVIMITLHDSRRWQAASAAWGADRFIPKRSLREELPGALAQLFSGRAEARLKAREQTPPSAIRRGHGPARPRTARPPGRAGDAERGTPTGARPGGGAHGPID